MYAYKHILNKKIHSTKGQPDVQRKCTQCEEEHMQRKPESNASIVQPTFDRSLQQAKGGRKLQAGTQQFMESRMGADFSNVRIHTGTTSEKMNRDISARAFTHGSDIYFNRNEYQPESNSGKELLAHELTHVVQQSGKVNPKIQRRVIDGNVVTNQTMLTQLGISRQDAIDTIRSADTAAIPMLQGAEDALTTQLDNAINGNPVNANTETILNEELGLSFNNNAHHSLIRQQRGRFKKIRETLESGYLRYMALGIGTVPLAGCTPGTCGTNFAFSCPGNRLVVLCNAFWNTPAEQAATILHEPFHIWYHMAHHSPTALRRADSSCFESFAVRIAGHAAFASCVGHTNG